MKTLVRSFIYIFLIVILLAGGLFLRLQKLVQSKEAEGNLIRYLEVITNSHVDYEKFNISFFPTPRAYFNQAHFRFKKHDLQLDAGDLDLKLSVPHLLLGQARISGVRVGNAQIAGAFAEEADGEGFQLKNVLLKTGTIKAGKPTDVFFESDMGEFKKAVQFTGQIWTLNSDFKALGFNLKGNVSHYEIPSESRLALDIVRFSEGNLEGDFHLQKESGELEIHAVSKGNVSGLVLEFFNKDEWALAPPVDGAYSFDLIWDEVKQRLFFNLATLETTISKLTLGGGINFEARTFDSLRFSAEDLMLDAIPKFAPGLMNSLPLYIGFSGSCDLTTSFQGPFEDLSVFTDWNFEDSLLTYGKYFNKSKGLPFHVNFNLKLERSQKMSGDFSTTFQDMKMKGTLKDVDLSTGSIHLNLITNKFSLESVSTFVPALQDFTLGGAAKFLADWDANFKNPEQEKKVNFNVSVSNGSLAMEGGAGISDLSFILDSSDLVLEVQDASMIIDGSPLDFDFSVYDLHSSPRVKGVLNAERLNVSRAYQIYKSLIPALRDDGPNQEDLLLDEIVSRFFPNDNSVHRLKSDFLYDKQKLIIESFSVEDLYGGQIAVRGEWDASQQNPFYWLEIHGVDVNLNSFGRRKDSNLQPPVEGAMSFKSFFQGVVDFDKSDSVLEQLNGNGKTVIKSGVLHYVDVLNAVSKIGPFEKLTKTFENTPFDQLEFDWNLSEARFLAGNFVAENKDLVVRGDGSLGLDGLVNFRLGAYMSESLVGHLFPEMENYMTGFSALRIGPVPLLLSGTLSEPDLKPDPVQVPNLVNKIQNGQINDILFQVYYE